ncbi:type I-U CRISPR-associated protein Csb2 [Brachybacterium sp. Marseille-Q7125]|uniref:type I-G CRISPR-associated protein Csb2 n=1 Tax=Brachybacterium sp. Marseille-Q7125 TaxID=2932815 RepID=UPI001FF1D246|nr:type I-U CRISPR-associated protein Csb2 [Brachybacterium sp. Marseille-Q7125]
MALLLTARWPGHQYSGHGPDGTAEVMPSFARVFSALVHAAATGAESATTPGEGHPDFPNLRPGSVDALRWLEENPPVGMHVPRFPDLIPAERFRGNIAYRKEGVFLKEGKSTTYKVTARKHGESSWISSALGWIWEDSAPPQIQAHLDALCADVSHLGEGDSPAVLEVFETASSPSPPPLTHHLRRASYFDPAGQHTRVPVPGRLSALEQQFREARPGKPPTAAADKHTVSTLPGSEQPTADGLTSLRLIPVDAPEAQVPWPLAVLLPVQNGPTVPPESRVDVAVNLHRALIAAVGQDCPPSITGRYPEGVQQPANRVALHWIPAGAPVSAGQAGAAHLVVLVPAEMAEVEHAQLFDGLSRIQSLRTRIGRFDLGPMELADGASFWAPPAPERHREWRTDPAAVPERWSRGTDQFELFAQSAQFSFTTMMRDHLRGGIAAPERSAWLQQHRVTVLEAEPVLTLDPTRFVHRTNRRMAVMPYTARLDLGTALPATAVCAIGQSRHLGGGLLIPIDRPRPHVEEAP